MNVILTLGYESYVRESRVTAWWTYVLLKGRKNSKHVISPITVQAISMMIQISH